MRSALSIAVAVAVFFVPSLGLANIVTVNNDNNAVFATQPKVSSAGTLTFAPALSAPTMTVHVSIAAHDDGGTANGGVDTSAAQTFNINVTHTNSAPVVNNDTYEAVGNTELAVGATASQAATLSAGGSLLANDSDPDGDPLTASLNTASSGANVVVNADGSFTYLPAAGFSGDDTFTYNVSDGQGHTVTGTVTIHVNTRVLYVKNDAGGTTGRIDSPFTTLAAAAGAAGDNDTIYVFAGDGATTGQSDGVALSHNAERLIGEAVALKATGVFNGVTNPQLRAAGSRPQISNTSGDAVSMAGAGTLSNLEVSGVAIATATGSGIKGTKVVNLSLTNNTISGVGGSGIAFDDVPLSAENNLSGNVTITHNTILNPARHGIDIQNFAGTLTSLNVSDNVITSATTTAASHGSGIRILESGNATTTATVVAASIAGNTVTNFPSDGGIIVQGGSGAGGPPAQMGTAGSATDVIRITGNQISGASAAVRMATQAINALVNRSGTGNFVVTGNGTSSNPISNMVGTAIAISAFGNVDVTATVSQNVLAPHNSVGNTGIAVGVDRVTTAADSPALNVTVANNDISFTDGNGILATARNSSGSLIAKIQNNTVAGPLSGIRPGIRVDSGTASGNSTVCLNISGNTSAGSGGSQGIGIRKQGTNSFVNAFGVNGMAATSSPGVEAYIDGLNPNGNGTLLLSATSSFTNCSNP